MMGRVLRGNLQFQRMKARRPGETFLVGRGRWGTTRAARRSQNGGTSRHKRTSKRFTGPRHARTRPSGAGLSRGGREGPGRSFVDPGKGKFRAFPGLSARRGGRTPSRAPERASIVRGPVALREVPRPCSPSHADALERPGARRSTGGAAGRIHRMVRWHPGWSGLSRSIEREGSGFSAFRSRFSRWRAKAAPQSASP